MIPRRVPNSLHSPVLDCVIDSGAYSAFRLGVTIDIDEYCDWLLANAAWIGPYVNLDTINPKDPEASARDSFKNYLRMRKRGLSPIGVFHAGEKIEWLDRMLDAGCDYVGLAASAMLSRNRVNDWYSLAWDHLVAPSGKPIVRVHAFGEGRLTSMKMFPWASSDSTSWVYESQRGGSMTLPGGQRVGHRNDGLHKKAVQDVYGMLGDDKDALAGVMAAMGIDMAGFEDRGSPAAFLLRSYVSLLDGQFKQQAVRDAAPVLHRPPVLFGFNSRHSESRVIDPAPFRFHQVIGNNTWAASILAYAGYRNTLASYHYICKVGYYRHLEDLCRQPRITCQTVEAFSGTYALLQKYVQMPEQMTT